MEVTAPQRLLRIKHLRNMNLLSATDQPNEIFRDFVGDLPISYQCYIKSDDLSANPNSGADCPAYREAYPRLNIAAAERAMEDDRRVCVLPEAAGGWVT
jgi:hypothetical protein